MSCLVFDRHRGWVSGFLLVVLCLAACTAAAAQPRSKSLQIRAVETPPAIDGRIDDACWQGVEPASGFVQYDPANGSPASEETLVWAAYDRGYVYFAFLLKDSRPDRIWAELTPRNGYWMNDSITVILDTYNDQRTSIQFTVNPRGVQSNSVETIWKSEAIVRQDGWSVEIAIPFKSLRFAAEDAPTWGVNFERYISRLSERDYWTAVERDKPLLTQMGDLRGLSSVRPGANLELFPYGGGRASRWAGQADDKMAGGLDVKYGIKSNLVLDLTASPDFSEVESDPFLYQLSPYENYFRERRPFFTEGSRYFETAVEGGGGFGRGPGFSLLYSRRIANPTFAAKLTGKAGGYSYGVLGASNDDPDAGRQPVAAVRLQKDVLGDSQVGLFFTSLDSAGERNRNVAADYGFRYRGIYSLQGLHALTFNSDRPGGGNGVHMVRFERDTDAGVNAELSFDRVERNVSAATGFVTRTDVQSSRADLGYGWRLPSGRLKHASIGASGEILQDTGGTLRGQTLGLSGSLSLRPEVELMVMAGSGRSRHQVYADDGETLSWTDRFIDTREVWTGLFWSRGGLVKRIDVNVGWEKRGVYDEEYTSVEPGRQLDTEASFTFRPRSNVEVEVGGGYTRQVLDSTGEVAFSGLTYEAGLHHQITRRLFLGGNVQGETRDRQYSVDLVAGYYFGAGNVFQFAYKKGSLLDDTVRERGYSLTAKVSYLLRL